MVCLPSYTLLPLRGISPQGETRNSEALSFCRPTELWAERWYAVPKGEDRDLRFEVLILIVLPHAGERWYAVPKGEDRDLRFEI